MIEMKGVSKMYPQAKSKALDHVSLTIPSGEFFGLLGPNGAGKTTLISILSTLLLPTEGSICIDGETLTRQRGDIKQKLALMGVCSSSAAARAPAILPISVSIPVMTALPRP